jgi:CRP-like cAMP-binding protein
MRVTIDIQHLIEKRFNSPRQFEPGDQVYSEGELFNGVFYIINGKVKIIKSGVNKQMTMRFCEANEFIGVIPFFDRSKIHCTTALVTQPGASLIHINEQDFFDFIGKYPDIQNEIANELCHMIDLTEMQIINSLQKSRNRFVDAVVFLARKEHKKSTKQTENNIIVKYTEEYLAELAQVPTKHLKKLLQEFKSNKLLKIQGNKLVIRNLGEFLSSK